MKNFIRITFFIGVLILAFCHFNTFSQCIGTTNVCLNSTGTYEYTGTSNNIRWTIDGGRITGGANSSKKITVTWDVAGNKSATCDDLANATSCAVNVTVKDAIGGTPISNTPEVCKGGSVILSLNNSMGTVNHWQKSINGGNSWTTINNTTTTLSESDLQVTTVYRASVSNCNKTVFSSNATVTVVNSNAGTISVTSGSTSFCTGESCIGILTLNGYEGIIKSWEKSEHIGGVWGSWITASSNPSGNTFGFSVGIPTRFRARVLGSTCMASSNNIIEITEAPATNPGYISISTGKTEICLGDIFSLSVNGNTGTVLQWYIKDDQHNWGNLTSPANVYITRSSYFKALVRYNNCQSKETAPFYVEVKTKPEIPIVQNSIILYNTRDTLTTEGAGPNEVSRWYNAPVNGNLLHDGNTFITPVLTSNTTYYVSKYYKTLPHCEGARTPVIVTVNRLPVVNAGPNKYLVLPKNDTFLIGTATDPDGSIISVEWTKLSGPETYKVINKNTLNLTVSDMVFGTYIFKLTAIDNYGFAGWDTVSVKLVYPPNNYNYIRETILLDSGITTEAAIEPLPVAKKNVSTTYYDGLGREIQIVIWQASPGFNDIIESTVYDTLGRIFKKFLPYTSNINNGYYKADFMSKQALFYSASGDQIADDNYPYSVQIYEASPLGRVSQSGAPGLAWQPSGSASGAGGKTTGLKYELNGPNEVKLWFINNSGLPSSKKYYEKGQLAVIATINEQKTRLKEYQNKNGKAILKQVEDSSKVLLQTYYVYDEVGRLRYILPPECINKWPSDTSQLGKHLNSLAFNFKYDAKGRIVERKAPGSGKVKILYDKRDRVVLSQDSVQSFLNDWSYTKYDESNRPIISGIHKDNRVITTIQSEIDAQTKMYEEILTNGYTQTNTYPKNPLDKNILSVNYYDNYSFIGKNYWDNSQVNYEFTPDDIVKNKNTRTYGMLTGTKTKTLKRGIWINKVHYYDNNNRINQNIARNFAGGVDIVSHKFDFTGKVLTKKKTHTGVKNIVFYQSFQYDHISRLIKTWHLIGSDATKAVLLGDHKYNELGQLVDKGIGVKNNVPVQSIDYRYHIRGWLTSINNSSLNNDGSLNDDSNDLFGMEFVYEKPLGIPGLAFNDVSNILFPSLKILDATANSISKAVDQKHKQNNTLKLGIGEAMNNKLTN